MGFRSRSWYRWWPSPTLLSSGSTVTRLDDQATSRRDMIASDYGQDSRVVMTLDAGGTNFRFSAMRGNQPVTPTIAMPSIGDDLAACLHRIVEGFAQVKNKC